MSRVELAGIVKNYGGVRALKGVDALVEPGRVLVLLGENGAGKSTLIKVLTGAVVPDAGEIRIDGRPVALRDPLHARSLGIAAVYQEPMVYPHLAVLENIFAGRELCARFGLIQRRRMLAEVRPWLARLDLPENLLHRPIAELGLGHMQLVLIAQALLRDARVIIFDEPTSILSRAETDRLLGIIASLRAEGRAVVYITHRLEEVPRIGDHVTVLTDGSVSGNFPAHEVSGERLLQLMAGKSRTAQAEEVASARAATLAARPMLSLRRLSHQTHFQDVGWDIQAGAITGVYGLVGAGRSEVAMSVFGMLARSAGEIVLDGKPVSPRSPVEAMKLGIGYLPEDRKRQGIFAPRSLENNLTANALDRFSRLAVLDFAGLGREAARMMSSYAIKAPGAGTAIGALSGGNQQKGLFARWAGKDLRVLILDEPTRGIDIRTKDEVHGFIRALAREGVAVVVISSDLAEIMAVSQRMIVMRRGCVVDRCEGEAMTSERVLASAIGADAGPQQAAPVPQPAAGSHSASKPGTEPRSWLRLLSSSGREAALLATLALVVLVVSLVSHGTFWNPVNVRSLLVSSAITAIPATGMTVVILTGGIDVSIGSMLGLVAATGGLAFEAHWPLILVAPLFCVLGGLLGALNAAIVLGGGVPPVVATLGTLSIFRMCVFLAMGSNWITAIPASLTTVFVADRFAGLPVATIIALALMATVALFLHAHRFGRHVYAVGNNDEAARLSGIRVLPIRFASYVMLGLCTGAASLLQLGESPLVQTSTGTGFELDVIAAVVLGGTELAGGRGTVLGTLLGTLIVGLVADAIVLIHIQPFWGGVVLGLIILGSVGAGGARAAWRGDRA